MRVREQEKARKKKRSKHIYGRTLVEHTSDKLIRIALVHWIVWYDIHSHTYTPENDLYIYWQRKICYRNECDDVYNDIIFIYFFFFFFLWYKWRRSREIRAEKSVSYPNLMGNILGYTLKREAEKEYYELIINSTGNKNQQRQRIHAAIQYPRMYVSVRLPDTYENNLIKYLLPWNSTQIRSVSICQSSFVCMNSSNPRERERESEENLKFIKNNGMKTTAPATTVVFLHLLKFIRKSLPKLSNTFCVFVIGVCGRLPSPAVSIRCLTHLSVSIILRCSVAHEMIVWEVFVVSLKNCRWVESFSLLYILLYSQDRD